MAERAALKAAGTGGWIPLRQAGNRIYDRGSCRENMERADSDVALKG